MTQIVRSIKHKIKIRLIGLAGIQQHLISINPTTILKRGFAVVTQPGGEVIRSVTQVRVGKELDIRVQDGSFPAIVQSDPLKGEESWKQKRR